MEGKDFGGSLSWRWHLRRGLRHPALPYLPQSVQIAANAETPETLELPVSVEHGQAGHLNGQAPVDIVHRPEEDDTAEGLTCSDRVCDLPLRIDIQGLRNIRPAAAKNTRLVRPQQIGEFLTCNAEVRIGISLPNKPEGKMVRVHCRCRKIRFWCPNYRCVLARTDAGAHDSFGEDDKQRESPTCSELENLN